MTKPCFKVLNRRISSTSGVGGAVLESLDVVGRRPNSTTVIDCGAKGGPTCLDMVNACGSQRFLNYTTLDKGLIDFQHRKINFFSVLGEIG